MKLRRRVEVIYGHAIPAPRVTLVGVLLAVVLIGGPVMVVATLLDLGVWAVSRSVFDTCVGLWCQR